jgi:FtsZ-interacting cell division protein ZipA
MLRELAPGLPSTFAAPSIDDETARAEALDRLCAELDMQIGITIERTDGTPIAGTRLRGVAEAAGFRLAPSGRFEWVQEDTGNVLYTMQTTNGEPFTLDALRTASLIGIVFVLDVPCVADPPRAFDQMKLAAGRLAHTLGGDMVDDNRHVLTDEALAKTRAAVAKAASALADVHIEPGSPRALKLFSA